jgi:hypothetical protein
MSGPRIVLFLGAIRSRGAVAQRTKYVLCGEATSEGESTAQLYLPWPILVNQAGGLAAQPHAVLIGSDASYRQWIDFNYLGPDLNNADLDNREALPIAFVRYDRDAMQSPNSPGFWAFFEAMRCVLSGGPIDNLPGFETLGDSPTASFQTTSTDVLVDITRGFRAVPFLGASALAFVQAEQRRERQRPSELSEGPPRVRHRIYYAALDDDGDDGDTTAVWDLSRFTEAVELSDALDAFTRHGRADDLADFFADSNTSEAKELQGPMRQFADDLLLMRLPDLLSVSGPALHSCLSDSLSSLKQSFPPLSAELDRLSAQVHSLVPQGEAVAVVGEQGLRSALILAQRLRQTGRYAELYNLLRESLLTAYTVFAVESPFAQPRERSFDGQRRQIDSHAATGQPARESQRSGNAPAQGLAFLDLAQQPSRAALTNECKDQLQAVRGLRNDVSHCSMRSNPKSAQELRERLKELLEAFERLVDESESVEPPVN